MRTSIHLFRLVLAFSLYSHAVFCVTWAETPYEGTDRCCDSQPVKPLLCLRQQWVGIGTPCQCVQGMSHACTVCAEGDICPNTGMPRRHDGHGKRERQEERERMGVERRTFR
ncbi:hypothetical protein KIPB_012755 [Kipferlia bialata]|uniref:Uncharacterized protein n=1 Tax=Kipferlia bialata TaxID=797122 RepID=A0A9K3D8K3_9EUKA|nr:hypothetical protein KIPB_012755 [Kipferlia bialata]|eukprot:g12755.t1